MNYYSRTTAIDETLSAVTWGCSIRLRSLPTTDTVLFSVLDGSDQGFFIRTAASNDSIQFGVTTTVNTFVTSWVPSAPNVSDDFTLACRYNGSLLQLFLNGATQGSPVATVGNLTVSTPTLTIGGATNPPAHTRLWGVGYSPKSVSNSDVGDWHTATIASPFLFTNFETSSDETESYSTRSAHNLPSTWRNQQDTVDLTRTGTGATRVSFSASVTW